MILMLDKITQCTAQMNGGTGVYTENDYYIVVQNQSNLYVRVIFRDQDAGDPNRSGVTVDENVNGNLTCSCNAKVNKMLGFQHPVQYSERNSQNH